MVILACVGLFMVLYGLTVIVKRRSQAKSISARAAPPTAKTTARDRSPLIFPEGKVEVAPRPVPLAKTTVRSGKPAGRPVRSSASSSSSKSSGGRRSDDNFAQGAMLGHLTGGSYSDNAGSHHSSHSNSGSSGGSSCGGGGSSCGGGGGGGCGGGGAS
jgi:hypothetical protein